MLRRVSDRASVLEELEAEWAELGRAPGSAGTEERPTLWIFPVVLLYTGFFFGPFVTVLLSALTLRRQFTPRAAGIILGTAGTAWCLLQGLSLARAAWWTELELQAMRSAFNFLTGVVTYAVVRAPALEGFRTTPRTLIVTLVVITIALLLFLATPPEILVALGR